MLGIVVSFGHGVTTRRRVFDRLLLSHYLSSRRSGDATAARAGTSDV